MRKAEIYPGGEVRKNARRKNVISFGATHEWGVGRGRGCHEKPACALITVQKVRTIGKIKGIATKTNNHLEKKKKTYGEKEEKIGGGMRVRSRWGLGLTNFSTPWRVYC